jgi:glycosyltransferase involved in cell wall biosynthesis
MAEVISEAINSVLNQTYKNFEIIVIDDGSSDKTKEIINNLSHNISYYYQSNAGPSAARNNGISRANGNYIAFLDADDMWLPEKLECQVDIISKNPKVKLVACGYQEISDDGHTIHDQLIRKNYKQKKKLIRVLSTSQLIPGSSSGVLIDKDCFNKLGVFDESLKIGEDWDMWLRIALVYDVFFIEKVLLVIRKIKNKPGYRVASNEEIYVSKMIEKTVPKQYRRRSYAALYSRVASNCLISKKRKEALKYFTKSILKFPFILYSPDPKNKYRYPNIYRYYLITKCIIPLKFFEILKNVFNR